MENQKAIILITEDDETYRKAVEFVLVKEGFDVHIASDGVEALQIAKEIHPDVILMDMLMPRMDGLEFLQAYTGDAIVIMLSNWSDRRGDEAIQLGAYKAFRKTELTPKQLVAEIGLALDEKRGKIIEGGK